MRVSEVYASVQGEGPRVGQTTVFLRFGGCNLRCPGWPCDTQHAIDPIYREEWKQHTWMEVFNETVKVAKMAGATLITLTGGEPFLQKKEELRYLVEELEKDGYTVEAFTNGTLEYPGWAVEHVHMIMDWKLNGSGEDSHNNMRIKNLDRLQNATITHSVKFVCKDSADFEQAYALWSVYLKGGRVRTYYGRVWNGEITNAELVERAMIHKLPWHLNVQVHQYIWSPNERGR